MGQYVRVRCPGCGWDREPRQLGLLPAGGFDLEQPYELSLRIDHIGGRGKLRVERQACPIPIAIGLRDMLRARLQQVEEELAAAGIES